MKERQDVYVGQHIFKYMQYQQYNVHLHESSWSKIEGVAMTQSCENRPLLQLGYPPSFVVVTNFPDKYLND